MSTRADPALLPELKQHGAVGIEACFNCGNCTAICPLTSDEHPFPRNMIRLTQLGLRDKLKGQLDPWLCYYCGECSDTCPREAEPAETMMAIRRWLIGQYDWTGLAKKFYTSKLWEIGSMLVMGLLVVLAFVLFHGPVVTQSVELNTFAPVERIHLADWIMAGTLLFFVGTNVLRMHSSIVSTGKGPKPPMRLYFTELWQLVSYGVTQKKWLACSEDEEDSKSSANWKGHLLLVCGYVTMLVMVVFFLPWFQTDALHPIWHPQRWLGYLATALLLYGAGRALIMRIRKASQMHRFSHASDWIFNVLLISVALTGILQHTFRYLGLPLATYYTYVIHLALVAPMLILEVPFGKWSHIYYRPLAIYFDAVVQKARERKTEPAEAVSLAS